MKVETSTRVDIKIGLALSEAKSLHEYLRNQPKEQKCGFSQVGQEEADLLERELGIAINEGRDK